jgi:hypothetical protein
MDENTKKVMAAMSAEGLARTSPENVADVLAALAKIRVTGQLPPRDPNKPAEAQGAFQKFLVQRVDGSDLPGGKHYGCFNFVLDLSHDPHAIPAIQAYAASCAATHPQLAQELVDRFGAAEQAFNAVLEAQAAAIEGFVMAVVDCGFQQADQIALMAKGTADKIRARRVPEGAKEPLLEGVERRRELQHAPLPRDAECALEHAAIALDKAGQVEAHAQVTAVIRDHLPPGSTWEETIGMLDSRPPTYGAGTPEDGQ